MATVTYRGPFPEGVTLKDADVTLLPGVPVAIDDALAAGLAAQPDFAVEGLPAGVAGDTLGGDAPGARRAGGKRGG